ncbi:MAG: transglutaminase domain-containing protein [Aristaeellaceae bacterium]
MRSLAFSFRLRLDFSVPVQKHHYTLRCLPCDAPHQRVLSASLRVSPGAAAHTFADACGQLHYGCVAAAHTSFEALAEGVVCSALAQGEAAAPDWMLGPYRMFTPLTAPGPAIRHLNEVLPAGAGEEALAARIMELMQARFLYLPGSTNTLTTGEEAAAAMCGVCQDESHIMLSLLRLHGVPCRYAVGYMLGEGSTHAWVEMLHAGRWIGLDPTNHRAVDDAYIRVSVGRDAGDCPVNRGVFLGGASQRSENTVRVWDVQTPDEQAETGREMG